MRWMGLALVAGAAAIGGIAPASASVGVAVPAASGNVTCAISGGYVTDPHACSANGATATLLLSPDVTLTASAATQSGVYFSPTASSILTYYFAVIGGQAGDVVPIMIDFNLAQHTTGSGAAAASFGVTTTNGGKSHQICDSGSGCSDHAESYTGAFSLTATVGADPNGNHIDTFAQAGAIYQTGGTAYAMVDPYIFVGPGYADRYSIQVSPGVGNAPTVSTAVPEPSTWALLVPAFGLVGGVLRRRPAKAARAAAY